MTERTCPTCKGSGRIEAAWRPKPSVFGEICPKDRSEILPGVADLTVGTEILFDYQFPGDNHGLIEDLEYGEYAFGRGMRVRRDDGSLTPWLTVSFVTEILRPGPAPSDQETNDG